MLLCPRNLNHDCLGPTWSQNHPCTYCIYCIFLYFPVTCVTCVCIEIHQQLQWKTSARGDQTNLQLTKSLPTSANRRDGKRSHGSWLPGQIHEIPCPFFKPLYPQETEGGNRGSSSHDFKQSSESKTKFRESVVITVMFVLSVGTNYNNSHQ